MTDRGVLSSVRYLFADVIGEDDGTPPFLPEGLPEAAAPVASEAIHLLIDYQGTSYAQLYVDRLKRFIGRNGVDEAMLVEIARLMAARMSYEDPIRIAQLKLAEVDAGTGDPVTSSVDDVRKFRLDELIGLVYSTSLLPRAVLDDRADAFEADVRERLLAVEPAGVESSTPSQISSSSRGLPCHRR